MPGDFDQRMGELLARMPTTEVSAHLEVNQVYAHYQHEGLDFQHPNGGQAKYLEQPWEQAGVRFGEQMAAAFYEPDGLESAARVFAEDGARMVYDHAPVEFGDLRESGHPTVMVDGHTTYDRPPVQPRLTEAELREKQRLAEVEGLGPVAR